MNTSPTCKLLFSLPLLVTTLVTTLAAATFAQAAAIDPLPYLAAAKLASGGAAWDQIPSLHRRSTLRQAGQDGTVDARVDLVHVRTLQRTTLGTLVDARAWDGKSGWSVDGSGYVQPGTSDEAIANGVASAYRAAYAFFWPARWPAQFVYGGARTQDNRQFDIIRITPDHADPFDLWLDHTTHLVDRTVATAGAQPVTTFFSDYHAVGGVLLPWIERESNGDPQYDTVASIALAAVGPAMAAADFEAPPQPAGADPFPPGRDRVTVPFRLIDNHIYFDASIDSGAARTFMFDTGATAIVDQPTARAMGLQPQGALAGDGFGPAAVQFSTAWVQQIGIGGFTLPAQSVLTLATAPLVRITDVDFSGVLGLAIAQRAVIVIDYENAVMTLIKPSAFRPDPSAFAIPLKFSELMPIVDASIDGVQGQFQIDTGATDSLTLMAPFAQAHQLAAKYHATRPAQATGAGGATLNLLARPGQLQIGAARIDRPVALIATDARGAGAATHIAGNIGGGALRKFTVTLDYPHQMLYLAPNRQFNEPDVYDRAGLRMQRGAGGDVQITYVVPGSGAALAGIQAGDTVDTVNTFDVRAMALPALRSMFKADAGSQLVLSVRRGAGAPRKVTLRLGDLI